MNKNPFTVIPAKAGILKIPGQARDDKNMDKNLASFLCIHCHAFVPIHPYMGTSHRNHCPFCLWSKHVDEQKAGDRLSQCQGKMEPIGLTSKHERVDKYGKQKQGEIMIVHVCTCCGKININRIAGDDDADKILSLLKKILDMTTRTTIQQQGIHLLGESDKSLIKTQLFGFLP